MMLPSSTQRGFRRFLRSVNVLVFVSVFVGGLDLLAQTGLPTPARTLPGANQTWSLLKKSNRLQVSLGDPSKGETLGLDGVIFGVGSETEGYNRWDLILKNANRSKFANDISLQLAFEISVNQFRYRVTVPIEIKAGSLQSRTSFLVPFGHTLLRSNWWNQTVEVRSQISQNGYVLPGLSLVDKDRVNTNSRWNYGEEPNAQSLLLASDARMKARNPSEWSNSVTVVTANYSQMVTSAESIIGFDWDQLVASDEWIHPNYGLALVDRLPTNWLEFSAREKIVMSVDDFQLFNAEQRDAILDYTLAGGEFIVSDLNASFDLGDGLKDWLTSLGADGELTPKPISTVGQSSSTSEVTIPIGFGKVVVSNAALSSFQNSMFNLQDSRQKVTMTRRVAADAMDWYIPRVGQPPVIGFSIFICAFALAAGPLLLWWGHYRLQRPVLVLIVFPPLALVITSLILCYSVLKDGFKTYARVRSISWVNQADSRGISYSRQTYFSGMPEANIAFSSRSEVLPTLSQTRRRGQHNEWENILLRWQDDQQIYSGFIKPRSQCQWTVTTPIRSIKTFDYVANPQSLKLTKIQNLMQDDWKLAVFCDKNSNVTRVGETGAGEQGIALETSAKEIMDEIRAQYKPLAFPPGYSSGSERSIGAWLTSDYYYSTPDSSNLKTGIEMELDGWLREEGLMVPGSFVIFLSSASYLDQPLREDVRESDSFHVLAGRW